MSESSSLKDLAPDALNRIPTPATRWFSRFALPLGIVCIAVILLLIMSWSALAPRKSVQVQTAVVRPVQTISIAERTFDEGSVIQAPGWVEPDPNPLFVSALTEGIVEMVIPLEGERVEVGDTIAMLVDGSVVEQGTHDELVRARGLYADYISNQMSDGDGGE